MGGWFRHARLYRVPRRRGQDACAVKSGDETRALPQRIRTASPSGSTGRTFMAMLSTKARAEASQVWAAANSRQACGEICQRGQARRPQIVVRARRPAPHRSRRGARSPETPQPAARWPAPRAEPGQRCRSCSETRRRRRRHRSPPVLRPAGRPEIPLCGYFRASAARAGPSPTTTLVPGRSRSRNASRFFSTATRPTHKNTGRGRPRSTARG